MDKEIYSLIKKRNEKGMELLINEYAPLIKAIVKRHLYNLPQYHEECINDVYLGIWNNIASFDNEKNILKNWIAAITKHRAIDYKRKYLRTLEHIDISELEIESNFTIEKELLKNELEYEIEEILKCLSVFDKQLFIKLFVKEESVEEVSEEFNIKPSVLYNRISRGKRKLKSIFSKS
ncbi:RNA polymerase, sigma-24 subunit, ECF subfamily [Clostridium sp. DL-VIII]|uniref:sigma-70 family RNA polymerase sigma factor n=1 Tax=Clostridium sp. DL-VIII TaxID=641107 RepID=UPI00023AF987|nr:sigma-70 family RNA polymerase sigma factor [Clostridium sp. DL-VIII]EHJ00597.1 RNA polymerase, sigma-24 subunit, ECF subfamily [Clostridium sp. DL-VIII]